MFLHRHFISESVPCHVDVGERDSGWTPLWWIPPVVGLSLPKADNPEQHRTSCVSSDAYLETNVCTFPA